MAKRISLREFQVGLVERLTSAARGETSRALLGVLSGKNYWLLNLSDAGEIVPLPLLSPVPLTKSWFVGIANIRGSLYSVVDLSAFMGGEATQLNADARLLLVGARHGINSALLVSKTLGLKNPDALEAFSEAAPDGEIEQPWVGEHLRDIQGNPPLTWRMLRIKSLLSHSGFLDIGR